MFTGGSLRTDTKHSTPLIFWIVWVWQLGIEFLLLRIGGRTPLICWVDVVEVLVISGVVGEVVCSREVSLMVGVRLVEFPKTANLWYCDIVLSVHSATRSKDLPCFGLLGREMSSSPSLRHVDFHPTSPVALSRSAHNPLSIIRKTGFEKKIIFIRQFTHKNVHLASYEQHTILTVEAAKGPGMAEVPAEDPGGQTTVCLSTTTNF